MNEEEAKVRCAELAAGHPDRARNQWLPVAAKDGTWSVARIGLPPPLDPNRHHRVPRLIPPSRRRPQLRAGPIDPQLLLRRLAS